VFVWRQIFTSTIFWGGIETAVFLHQKPERTAFADWLTDLFTFSAFTVWDFFNLRIDLGFKGICNASWEFF